MPAPDVTAVAALLRERWSMPAALTLSIEEGVRDGRPRLIAQLERPATGHRPRERVTVDVTHLRGGLADTGWDQVADALDALVGTLVETDLAYRELPTGSDVTHGDGVFWVDVTCVRPDLEGDANAWLHGH